MYFLMTSIILDSELSEEYIGFRIMCFNFFMTVYNFLPERVPRFLQAYSDFGSKFHQVNT